MRDRAAPLAALFLVALALRPQIVAIGPLLPQIQDGLGLPHAVAGLLATIPVLCLGLFALGAAWLTARLGSRTAIALSLGFVAVFGVLRALVPDAALVLLLTVPVGIGIGFANALMPVAVKERVPELPSFATGVYATGINLGAAVATAAAVPLAHLFGGWRASLVAISACTGLLVVVWLKLLRAEPAHRRPALRPPRLPARSVTAWWLALTFGTISVTYYGLNTWLPDSYVERGWSEGSAGALLGVFNAVSVPTTLVLPWLAERLGSRRTYLMLGAVAQLGGMLGVVLLPGAAWLWAVVLGFGLGTLFTNVMTLPLDVGLDAAHVGAVTGIMLGGGYALSALSPFVLGAVRDAAGGFTPALWLLVGVSACFLLAAWGLTVERLARGVRVEPGAGLGCSARGTPQGS